MSLQLAVRTSLFRTLLIGVVLTLVVLAAFGARDHDADAAGSGFRMAFAVKAPSGVCDSPTEPTTCDLPVGTKFNLSVELIDPPAGYHTVQVMVSYGALIYNPTPFAVDEWVWPDVLGTGRGPPSANGTEGFVTSLGNTGSQEPRPVSSYEGSVIEFSMRCTNDASSTDVSIPIYAAGTNVIGATLSGPAGQFLPKSIGLRDAVVGIGETQLINVADELTVNCLDTLPTYTPTPLGPTAVPTATPLPVEGDAGMDLVVKSGGVCDAPVKPLTCDVLVGSTFTLATEVNDRPATGYTAFQVRIARADLIYKATPLAIEEIVWPECVLPLRSAPAIGSDLAFACASSLLAPFPVSTHRDNILAIQMTCPATAGSRAVGLVPYVPVVSPNGSGFLLPGVERVIISVSDSLTINCVTSLPTPTPAPVATPASVGGVGAYPDVGGGASSAYEVIGMTLLAVALCAGVLRQAWRWRPR